MQVYSNCKLHECNKTIEEVKLAKITPENENSYYKCSSCKVYIVFMIVVFTIFTGITIYFVYYNWSLIKKMFLALNLILAKKQRFSEYINGRNKTNKY